MKIQKAVAQQFDDSIYSLKGISKKAVEEHIKLYQGYITKYNEIQEKLAELTDKDLEKANQTFSKVRELKLELTFAYGGMINHEIYFNHLGGDGKAPEGNLLKQITEDFGSYEQFKKELKASALAARGWVWLAWNELEERLVLYIGDAQNSYPVWFALPIMALDVYEHAYFMDFGSARGQYVESFLENMDWSKVEENFLDIVGDISECGDDCECGQCATGENPEGCCGGGCCNNHK